jgi:hypothetical protein
LRVLSFALRSGAKPCVPALRFRRAKNGHYTCEQGGSDERSRHQLVGVPAGAPAHIAKRGRRQTGREALPRLHAPRPLARRAAHGLVRPAFAQAEAHELKQRNQALFAENIAALREALRKERRY